MAPRPQGTSSAAGFGLGAAREAAPREAARETAYRRPPRAVARLPSASRLRGSRPRQTAPAPAIPLNAAASPRVAGPQPVGPLRPPAVLSLLWNGGYQL